MNRNSCPKIEKCPIFRKNVFYKKSTSETYRELFCEAGECRYSSCKRYKAAMKMDMMVPENILPNSTLSVDEILMIMSSSLN